MRRTTVTLTIALAILCITLGLTVGVTAADARGDDTKVPPPSQVTSTRQAFQELFDASTKSGTSLAFHVGGQTIGGVVIRVIGDDAVEVRNREFSHIVIPLDRIDAVAAY